MQRLTIQAATHLSAQGLYSALSDFHPELVVDDEDKFFVSVDLGSDRQVVEVLDALHRFLDSRAEETVVNSMVVSLDERHYTLHSTPTTL
jgi:hypothetical protein